MTWKIQTRTITFDCPALPETIYRGPDRKQYSEPLLTVRSIRGREAVGELFEYTVLAEVEHPDVLVNVSDAAQVDLQRIVGTHGIVSLQIDGIGTFRAAQKGDTGRANIGADTRYIAGNIATARIICAEDRAAVYEFVLRPSVWWATRNRNSRIFKGSVTDILEELLRDRTMLDWRIAGPWSGMRAYPPRDFIRQAWETDWSFALRLMEEWGLCFWFEHNDHGHTLVISDTLGGFHDHGIAYETLRYHTDGRIDEEHINELSVTYTATAGKATVNDHDYMRPRLRRANAPLREEYEDPQGTANERIEIYAPAEFAQPDSYDGPHASNNAHEEGQLFARVMLQAVRCEGLRAHGKGHLRGLQPGRTFTLANYPQEAANREYIVLSCELELTEVGTSSGSWRHYSVHTAFELQPATEFYRLPQVTPRPHVGNEYAVIVTPKDSKGGNYEWWIDDKNRALIQYDWDREAKFDGSTSIWVRLASQWQGNEMGVVTPARAGQMVIVSHVHGDPDRPYISGFVVDKYNRTPLDLPHNAAVSGQRSQSLGNSQASNHCFLDDTFGKMQAQLASDHDKSILSLGFNTFMDGHSGRGRPRGSGFELRTDGHGAARAAKGLLITTKARPNASGHALDMGETIARLTQARDLHETLAELARHHGAQPGAGNQTDVARTIKAANDDLRGNGTSDADTFPEYTKPHLTLSSPVGIQSTTAGSTHVASGEDLAVTSGRNVSIAAARSMFANVANTFALFVQKAGIALTAAAGRIRIEAQRDGVEIIARKDTELVSTDGWINLTAAKGIRLHGGGSVLEIGPQGLRGFTLGEFLIHAASHATDAPQEKPVMLPMTDIEDAKIAESFVLVDNRSGLRIANQPYRITLEDGQVIKGQTNDAGEMALVLANTMQPATVEVLHNDGTDNPTAILSAVLTQSANRGTPPAIVADKKTSRVGNRELQVNDVSPESSGHGIYYAICQPYNWGMRYSVKDSENPKRLAFPVARQFAIDLADVLIEKVKWGENYFGKGRPEITVERFPLGELNTTNLRKLLSPVITMALTSSGGGTYALPVRAIPTVIVTDTVLIGGAKGAFDGDNWSLSINTEALQILFQPCGLQEQVQREIFIKSKLRDFADTIFHETRHCQQYFWIYAVAQQMTAMFPDTPNIAAWPNVVTKLKDGAKIAAIAAHQPIPNDSLIIAGIKQMAAGIYVWDLSIWRQSSKNAGNAWYPPFAPDASALTDEYNRAYKQSKEILKDVGAGGTSIDIDDMLASLGEGYQARPWENDAFFCGEIAGEYWSNDHAPDGLVGNQCSRQYALAHNGRERYRPAGNGA